MRYGLYAFVSVMTLLVTFSPLTAMGGPNDASDGTQLRDSRSDCNNNGIADENELRPLEGHALVFDGVGDYVDPGASTALAELTQGNFTIEAWIRTDDPEYSALVSNAKSSVALYNFVILSDADGGVLRLRVDDGTSSHICTGNMRVNDGNWHHVAAAHWMSGGGSIRLYVDGEECGVCWGDYLMPPFTADKPTLIGRDQYASPHYFTGAMDDVRVWNVGRFRDDIHDNMYRVLNGDEEGLVAYWRFDEGEGLVAYDSAGDSDGTLVSSPAWAPYSADCNGNETPDECEVGGTEDCNENGTPDLCDIYDGISSDCNENAIPDECEVGGTVDCNENGSPDLCDIYNGISPDCNENDVPDECDIADAASPDCNENDVPDECDIAGGSSPDCNENDVPDECDIADAASPDCNENDVPDECDIAGGSSPDCNASGVPDECEAGGTEDCNENGVPDLCDIYEGTSQNCNENDVPDECDIAGGSSPDCNASGIPDECEAGGAEDCNENGVPDLCDIYEGTNQDCNTNGVPDECEAGGTEDCNENGVPDLCDIYEGTSQDCNSNGIPDECDIAYGVSPDYDGNGVPDECQVGGTTDCNSNGTPDLHDIYDGISSDCNSNSIPDECEPVPNGVIYVDDDATGGLNDGMSWADAFMDLQDALAFARCQSSVTEIRVAGGTYKPGTSRDDSFQLVNGVSLRGGYRGLAAGGDRDDRDIDAFESILSGELGDLYDSEDNCLRVVNGLNVDASAVIDGFTIAEACNRLESHDGGGVHLDHASPTISHCRIVSNLSNYGGGMSLDHASPTISHCRIVNNISNHGGGIYCHDYCNPTLSECTFYDNLSVYDGAAMYNHEHNSPTLRECTFNYNDAMYRGGAIYNHEDNSATLINCRIAWNQSYVGGSVMYNYEYNNSTFINCTIYGNLNFQHDAAIRNGAHCHTMLTNCILWGNSGSQILNSGEDALAAVTYSCVEGGWDGVGNIDTDPLFVDPDGPDDIFGTEDDDMHLLEESPCINAGDAAGIPEGVTTDLDGEDRVQLCRVDMGAYEMPYSNRDCNSNGVPDACDIADGASEDYNGNSVPDECESGITEDCNSNGLPDLHDIYDGVSTDCNENAIPDECEFGGTEDCNENGVADLCDIYNGTSHDCRGSGVPDECESTLDSVMYVDGRATGGLNDGSSWADAFVDLQDALAFAACDESIAEIRVAGGTYKPGTSRDDSFQLVNGVSLWGGYRGLAGGGNPDDRDFDAFVSILSGDVGVIGDTSDNSEVVVDGSNTDSSAVIEGFTITGAYGTGYRSAIYIKAGSPTIAYCTICSNVSRRAGGMVIDESSPTISHCTISDNQATGLSGGGILGYSSELTLTDCTIDSNVLSGGNGGGMFLSESHATLTGCTFRDNSCRSGAGIYLYSHSSADLINCTFSGNRATHYGGGILYDFRNTSSLTNCTFTGNSASVKGGGICTTDGDEISVTNCIFWGNTAPSGQQMSNRSNCSLTVSHSCVQGGYSGTGNIDADPLFVDADGPDDVFGTEDDDVHLLPDSPCVNAGDDAAIPSGVTSDFEGEDRIQQCRVDMGADETPYFVGEDCNGNGVADECDIEAGTSLDEDGDGVPDECPSYGDCDHDLDVDLDDFNAMSSCLLGPGVDPGDDCYCFDSDADSDVDLEDFAEFQIHFTGPLE